MIKGIGVRNFKSLKDIQVATRRLNLLAGLNGMGKSSFIQTLLLLKQSDEIASGGILKLNGPLVDIGKGKDALCQFAPEDKIDFSLFLDDSSRLEWSFDYRQEYEFLESRQRYAPETLSRLFASFHYLSAERLGPMMMYETSQPSVSSGKIGERGEYAPHFLHVNGNRFKIDERLKHEGTQELTLMNQVNGWLGEISPGIALNVVEVPGIDKILLNYRFNLGLGRTDSFRPGNVGFGVSYVLSIITSLLAAGKESILIMENPEAHIHPRGQVKLGKLMAMSAAAGVQLFIETHSDHIINGVRVAIKDGLIPPSDVAFSYFTKKTTKNEQHTEITEIDVDERGELSAYPKDFLDEWNNQLLKLV
ncbi:Predicted ATPase [Candidatus Desulfarcum epimagneticum]|uniref:Predicted ATPase n=1 Tax=uncultured Desulfobacteraceae bacterium TaxID=218296 RepID=A0A484HDV2_9BACT|nr:Predicted ATPase [uncultured Desulfobacteraceae bacterium]